MSMYETGTVSATADATTITGSGTKWADQRNGIGPQCTIAIYGAGTVDLYAIAKVDSDTQITVTRPVSKAFSGAAYGVMVAETQSVQYWSNMLASQLGYYQSQMDGWQEIMTGDGEVTLTAPDGREVTISSFKKLTDDMAGKAGLIDGAVPVAQGGTGAKTAAGARTNLGLGTAATRDIQTSKDDVSAGKIITNGNALAIRTTTANSVGGTVSSANDLPINAVSFVYGAANDGPGLTGTLVCFSGLRSTNYNIQMCAAYSGGGKYFKFRTKNGDANQWNPWFEFYHTGNTTRASDGTLKAASPVARIVRSQEETERNDIDEEGFIWCGSGTCNAESEGITITRDDVGVYSISGASGLAAEGWRLLPPKDPEGGATLGIVEAEESPNKITIRLYSRKYALVDGDIVEAKGDPIDVPVNSWIDVRLDMPEDSIWNQRQQVEEEPTS